MRKISLLATLLLCAIQLKVYAQTGSTFKQWGEETLSQIEQDFRLANSTLYRENMENNSIAFNWPQGVQLHALIAARKISQAEALANEIHDKYWCYHNNIWGYNAGANYCGDRYYDDNAWIAKALMELYFFTNNATYLNRSKEVIAFSMSGENFAGDEPNGGIKWQEGQPGHCLCATAPTMVTNLMIYQATGEQSYLDAALRLYNWVHANRFGLGGGYRGYENAVITQAAIRLYQITGNNSYYNDAKHMGLAMETVYIDYATHSLHETGQWGGHDMTAAYVELYNLDGDINWLNIAAGYSKFLHDNCKDPAGRYPEDWSDIESGGKTALLYQASAARAFADLGNTPGGQSKYPDPVSIYRDIDYNAFYSTGLQIGNYTAADLEFIGMPDNQISSVKVNPGYKIVLFKDDNFSGDSLVLTTNSNYVGGFNDAVSSAKVSITSPTAIVYKDCNYTGKAINLPAGEYSLQDLQVRGINNKDISSIKIGEGYEVVLYKGSSLNGESLTLTSSASCLVSNTWNDSTSSLLVTCNSTPITPYLSVNGGNIQQTASAEIIIGGSVKLSPEPANEGTWSWTGPNFSSSQREVTINNMQSANSGTYTATYTSASGCVRTQDFHIEVTPQFVTTMYSDCNYTGYAVGLPIGDYDMFELNRRGIENDDVSSIKIEPGYEVVVYEDYNFTGASYILSGDDNCLVDNELNDWVSSARVRKASNSFSKLIEAEDYSSMSGVQTEATTDTNGGMNVGYIETADWMAYTNINIPQSGTFMIEYRIASGESGGKLSLDLNAGSIVLGEVSVPATGGWQSWTTVSHTVNINAGTYDLGIYAQVGGWNINWIKITQISAIAQAKINGNNALANASLELYPNPATDRLVLKSTMEIMNSKISIYDAMGKLISQQSLTTTTIDVSSLKKGIYLLKISGEQGTVTKRFEKH